MGKIIVDIDPRELSFIKNEYKGEKWSPVNGDAVVLSVKGEKQTIADKVKGVIDTLKAIYFPTDTDTIDVPQTYPVGEDVPDNIDHDGDGAEDYSAYALAICYAGADINQAMCLNEPARSQAIVAIVDKFRAEAQAQFGSAEKAGARHSKSDMDHLQAIADAVSNAAQAVNTHLASLGMGDKDGENEVGEDNADEKADKDPYGDVKYADPGYQDDKKKRYPLDTEEHVRAAASYFGMEKNRSKYSEEQQKEIDARIAAAEKKFGIGKDDEKDEKGETEQSESTTLKAQLEALITAKAAEFEQQLATVKTEAQAQIDTLKTESQSRVAELEAQLTAATTKAEAAEKTIKAMIGEARKPSSPGFVPTLRENGTREDPAAEVTKGETLANVGKPNTISEVIRLQRLAAS